jgi:glycosyltransferase involved in cell wall biosynthesis
MAERHPDFAPITLVLTVHDSASELPELLASIGRQRLLPSEVSVTDLGSTDGTVDVLRAWVAPWGVPVRVISAPGASTSVGRNLAIEAASFEHVAVTHGAVCLHPEWLARMWDALSEGNDVIAGRIEPVGSTVLQRTIGLVQTPAPDEMESASMLPSSRSIAFPKAQWDAVGGYPEWLRHGQDEAFSRALRSAGAAFRFVPAAVSSWNPRQSLAGYLSSCFRVSSAEAEAGFISNGLAARLAAYVGLAAFLACPRSTVLRFAATAAWIVHAGPYLRRVWRTRAGSPDRLPGRVVTTVAVVVGADAGWLAGYPTGLLKGLWHSRSRVHDRHRGDPADAVTPATSPIGHPPAGRHRRVNS